MKETATVCGTYLPTIIIAQFNDLSNKSPEPAETAAMGLEKRGESGYYCFSCGELKHSFTLNIFRETSGSYVRSQGKKSGSVWL